MIKNCSYSSSFEFTPKSIFKMPVQSERTRLNKRAEKKEFTWNPFTSFPAKIIMRAFIANRNKPRVTMVIGMVRIVSTGFTIVFKNASAIATISADK